MPEGQRGVGREPCSKITPFIQCFVCVRDRVIHSLGWPRTWYLQGPLRTPDPSAPCECWVHSLRYLHVCAGYMASRSPLVCFLLTVAGLAHLLMVPWKLCLRFLGAGRHMDIVDCRVAPMGTAVYSFISHSFLSLSPQHRWARLLATVFC